MKRRVALLMSVAILGIALWWWTSDDPTWACGRNDKTSGCVAEAWLDLDGLGLDQPRLTSHGLGVSPDGSEVVAAIRNVTPTGATDRAVVAVFDASTGERLRVLTTLERSDGEVRAQHLAVSPNGSLVAVTVRGDGYSALTVFDAATGAEETRLLETDGDEVVECVGRLSFSPDSRSVQCDRMLIDIESGEEVAFPDGVQFASFSGGVAVSSEDRTADWYRSDLRVSDRDDSPTVLIPMPDLGPLGWERLGFSPNGSLVVVAVLQRDRGWTLRSSARSHPGGSVVILDLETEQQRAAFDMAQGFRLFQWSADGSRLVGMTDDLTVISFDTTAW